MKRISCFDGQSTRGDKRRAARCADDSLPQHKTAISAKTGFTLIELIGVLAIMAIMASVLVPNVLRSIDRASVLADQQTVANLGAQFKVYVRNSTTSPAFPAAPAASPVYPAIPAWSSSIGAFTDLSSLDIAYNKRLQPRAYLTDPAAPSVRVMILSSMKTGLNLPAQGAINAAGFQQIWQTADGIVPPVTSWAGWAAWSAQNGFDYLVIQRIDLHTELQPLTIKLSNADPAGPPVPPAPTYLLYDANNVLVPGVPGSGPVPKAVPVTLLAVPRYTLTLKDGAGNIVITYKLGSSDKSFIYNGTTWVP